MQAKFTPCVRRGLFLWGLLFFSVSPLALADTRPNILVIIADDLGYTDIGPYGGEISTPSLDRLAANGISLSNFHALPTCSPTRSVLLTGSDNHIAGIGSQILTERQRGQPGYEGYLSIRTPTIAQVLSEAGYHTYLAGKWHLGIEEGQRPHDYGFQETFSLASGGASHFADATALSPLEAVLYSRNGQVVNKLPDDFYSSHAFTDAMLSFMEENKNSGNPFFGYLSYSAPHDPLHAPEEYIAKYNGVYDDGYEVLRERRHAAARAIGVIPEQLNLGEWPSIVKRWQALSNNEKAEKRRDMQTYAAMIDYMDEQIGRVLDWLEDNDQLDNTLILFMSDNGANPFPASLYPGYTPEYHQQFDNSLENRGLQGSFTELGSGWSSATSAGLRLFKAFSTEGGIRVPAIIKPVGGSKGGVNHSFIHVQDIMPTLLDITEIQHPAVTDKALPGMTGRSQSPLFQGDASHTSEASGVGYELHGTRAYISNQWKILQMPVPMGSGEWALFNIKEDPAEANDLANDHPQILADLVAEHEAYEERVGVIYDLVGPPAKITALAKAMLGAVFLLAIPGLVWGFRSSGQLVTLLGLTHLGGALVYINGLSQPGIALICVGAGGVCWCALRKNRWVLASMPVLALLLLLGLWYLKSGLAVSLMLA